MLLDLSEEHKEHLAFLPQVDSTGQGTRPRRVVFCGLGGGTRGVPGAHGLLVSLAVVAEFGRIAVEFLRRGSNPKIYEGAASKPGRGTSRGSAGHSFAPWRDRGFCKLQWSSSPCGRIKAERLFRAQILPIP